MYAKPALESAPSYRSQIASPNATIPVKIPAVSSGTVDFGEADYRTFQKNIESRFGVRLGDYKIDQMLRRIRTLAEQKGHKSFASTYAAMLADSSLLSAFLDTMTINVTEMLRNVERFDELVRYIFPELLAKKNSTPLSIWSAGCSYGAEAYTVAMLLHEIEPSVSHKIRGTDIDLTILSRANSISFSEADMVNISPARRQTFFMDMGGALIGNPTPTTPRFRPMTSLRNKVSFSQQDLLAGPYPTAEYDLILCRNVLIYFTDDAKERIYEGFYKALKPGGVLFIGGTERLADHRRVGFELIRPFFYRKPK